MTKLYMQNALYAREHGEQDLFRAHLDTMKSFVPAFHSAVSNAIIGYSFYADTVIESLSEKFSFELVECVIAYMVTLRGFDGRLDDKVRRWAKRVQLPATFGEVNYTVDRIHSIYLNALAEEVMKKSRY